MSPELWHRFQCVASFVTESMRLSQEALDEMKQIAAEIKKEQKKRSKDDTTGKKQRAGH